MKWQYDKRPRHKLRIFGIALIVVAILVLGALIFIFPKHSYAPASNSPAETINKSSIVDDKEVEGRYLLNGTVVWARAVEREAQLPSGKYDFSQPFSQLKTFDRAKYDAWSTDFECPITNNVVPFSVQVSQLEFNCRPEFLGPASKYFNIYDLANNHTDNQGGEKGLEETRAHLKAAGVQYFGSFDPSIASDVCEVIALPVRIIKSDKTEQKSQLPVAFCAWHYFYRKPLPGEIAVMDKYAKIMPVFAFAEMGTEYSAKANSIQQEIAHQIIDHNPAFLIANNPHWVQNTEVYNGKLIVYSTGNFIFDQLDAETQRSASIDVAMSVNYDSNVAKWLALGPKCASFQDNCLQLAQDQNLSKISLSYKYGVVAGQGGDRKLTHKADLATQQAVLARTNWSQTCALLGANACQ